MFSLWKNLIFCFITSVICASRCRVDNSQPNLIFTQESREIQPGEYVENYGFIAYKCNPEYYLEGRNKNVCTDGKWLIDHPACLKPCSNHIISESVTQPTCEFNDTEVSCNQSFQKGAKVTIPCQITYTLPDQVTQEVLVCGDDGEWEYQSLRCDPICGTVSTADGEKSKNNLVPWNAIVYGLRNGNYQHFCSGTIISERIVLSVAHCFWDAQNDRPSDKNSYTVGVGKSYRDYNAIESLYPQFFNLSDIHIPPEYKGIINSFQSNIAVLILKNSIVFNSYIKPICIEWQNYSNRSVKSNIYGRVAGWGRKEDGQFNNELRVLNLPTVSNDECIEKIEPKYGNILSNDKFCVDNKNGLGLCQGDSGAAFSISKTVNGIETYFLWGIVSNGYTHNCSGDYLTAFTNIQLHSLIIIKYENKYRPKGN